MKIVRFRDRAGKWRFRVMARNHKIIAQSEGYERKSGCNKAIVLLRKCHLWAVVDEENP